MPRAEYEALEARRQARRDRGDDSDDSTVANDDDDDDDDGIPVQIGQDNLADLDLDNEMNNVVIEDMIEVAIRRSTTSMFQRVLLFCQGAAESL